MRRGLLFAVAVGAGALSSPLPAQVKPPTQAQQAAAVETLKVIMAGLQSKDVPEQVKSAIVGCLYLHNLREISEKTTTVMKQNKLDPKDPNKRLTAIAAICGVRGNTPAKPGK